MSAVSQWQHSRRDHVSSRTAVMQRQRGLGSRITALAQVHKATASASEDDLDLDPALAACVQLGPAGHTPEGNARSC